MKWMHIDIMTVGGGISVYPPLQVQSDIQGVDGRNSRLRDEQTAITAEQEYRDVYKLRDLPLYFGSAAQRCTFVPGKNDAL